MSAGSVRLDLEYDGTPFNGWAAQPGQRTIQAELEVALATILREPVELTVAGRTDTGVHARGQVASFETTAQVPAGLARRLNGLTPHEIVVTAAARVEDGFDARRDARSRSYRYRILTRPSPSPFEVGRALWWPHKPFDTNLLDACAEVLVGTHDFTAFTPTQTDHVRFERNVLRAEWGMEDEILALRITADSFLRSMVRVLVGTMLEVAGGRRSVEDFARLLSGAVREEAGETAPPHGLYLESVAY